MRPGEASETARRVAAHRLGVSRLAIPTGNPSADDALARDVAGDLVVDRSSAMAVHLAARTAFFDGVVVDAISGGTTQVVIVGAGYDARSLRFAAPGVQFIEVDHPDTQRDKLARLGALGIDTGAVRFVAADLRDGVLGARLGAVGHDAAAPSLFIIEGVAAYLDDSVLVGVLGELRAVAADASTLAISVGARDSAAVRRRRAALAAAVSRVGERFSSTVTADTLASVLTATGWRESPSAHLRDAERGFALLEVR